MHTNTQNICKYHGKNKHTHIYIYIHTFKNATIKYTRICIYVSDMSAIIDTFFYKYIYIYKFIGKSAICVYQIYIHLLT